ncbi:MAG: hypothetical protein AAGF92_15555 [Myxococcota bacterium]
MPRMWAMPRTISLLAGLVFTSAGCASETELGMLALDGPDARAIGGLFEPRQVRTIPLESATTVSWNVRDTRPDYSLSLTIGNQGAPGLVRFRYLSPSGLDFVQAYEIECSEASTACRDLSVDPDSRSVSFDGFRIPDVALGSDDADLSTAPLRLTGTLRW